MIDKRLTPAPTANQRRVLEYVLRNPGCAMRPAAETVRATDKSPNNASYNAVWRCVRRGWLAIDKTNKTARGGCYSLVITLSGVTEIGAVEWRKHPQHGYMARKADDNVWCTVVTALCLNVAETQDSADAWRAHKSRLRVNGGCGFVAVDSYRHRDVNDAFVLVSPDSVPSWIVADFSEYLNA